MDIEAMVIKFYDAQRKYAREAAKEEIQAKILQQVACAHAMEVSVLMYSMLSGSAREQHDGSPEGLKGGE